MTNQIKRKLAGSLALLLLLGCIIPTRNVREVGASDGIQRQAAEISMSQFCEKDSDNQSGWIVTISSVQDLEKLREFLEENPTGKGNIFKQTCDIKVSPYTYEYLEEYGRIAICYNGEPEVYYDAVDDSYYEQPAATGSAITYQWKTSSWISIGGELEHEMYSDWKYLGNQHTIEGIYQKVTSKSSKKNTGIFQNVSQISGVRVKNYFGISKNMQKTSVLGNGLCEVRECVGESIELIVQGDSLIGNVGFVAELRGDIVDTKVEADIITTSPEVDVALSSNDLGAGYTGIIAGDGGNYAVSNCESTGRILHAYGRRNATGGVVGFSFGKILGCKSSVQIQGDISDSGGIVGCAGYPAVMSECRFQGSVKVKRAGTFLDNMPNAGGICGLFVGSYLNRCQNDGRIESNRGGMGGIVGYFGDGEVLNCVNRGQVVGGADEGTEDQSVENDIDNEDVSLRAMAGGIAGRLHSTGTGAMEIALYNSYHEGEVCSWRGAAGGIVGSMEEAHSEVANVCSVGRVSSEMEADYVTGLWQAGVRESCLDGRDAPVEELCGQLNQWIALLPTSDTEHYMVAGEGSEMYPWSVVDQKLTLGDLPMTTTTPSESPGTEPGSIIAPSESPGTEPSPTIAPSESPGTKPIPTTMPSESPGTESSPTIAPSGSPGTEPNPAENPGENTGETAAPGSGTDSANSGASSEADKKDSKNNSEPKNNTSNQKKAKWKAPTFSLKNKVDARKQKYVLVTLKKYQGKYVEVWAKIENQKYRKITLSENKISKLHGKLKFKYTFSKKKIYFKLRTYQKKNGKKIYSKVSKGKRITTK